LTATTSTTAASSRHDPSSCTCLVASGGVADGDGVGLDHARGAGAVGALFVPSASAPKATEPGACASPRAHRPGCTPGVQPTMSSGTGRRGRGLWRRSRAASRCQSAGTICATGDRVVPKAADPNRDCVVQKGAAALTPRQDQPPPSMWPRSQRRRRSPSGCSGCPGGASVGCFTHVVGVLGSANQGIATPAPPLATWRDPPHITASRTKPARLTRVPLTFNYTAHTTHSHHRLPLAARFHSRAPADMFLVPARSPRNIRPSRRPRRAARPLVRPTSFMRTTMPWSPPAKALSTMSRLRCAQSLHECGQKGR